MKRPEWRVEDPKEMLRNTFIAAGFAILLILTGCSSSKPAQTNNEQKPQATPKATEMLTGREAFQKLYVAARGWAPDIKPFRLQSESAPDAKGQDGKAAIWRASFASPARRSMKSYLWTGIDQDGNSRGVTPGTEDSYNPSNSATQVFELAFLKIDSDKAFSVAQQHGDKITKKDPAQPVSYTLDWNASQNKLIWHVIYGTSRSDQKLAISVDATTGEFLRVEK